MTNSVSFFHVFEVSRGITCFLGGVMWYHMFLRRGHVVSQTTHCVTEDDVELGPSCLHHLSEGISGSVLSHGFCGVVFFHCLFVLRQGLTI